MKDFITKNIKIIASIAMILSIGLVFAIHATQSNVDNIINKSAIITKTDKCNIKKNQKTKAKNDVEITNATNDRVLKAKTNLDKTLKTKLLGEVNIPSVNIKLPIFKGMTDDTLLNGVGTYDSTRKMGYGNYVMLAHNLPLEYKDALLQPLIDIQMNDEIVLTDFEKTYTYKVSYKGIVDQSQTGILGDTTNSMLTIFRCVGAAGSTKRLVVQAQLDDIQKIENPISCSKESVDKKKDSKIKNISDSDKTALDLAKSTSIAGTAKTNWFHYALAMIPGILGVIGVIVVSKRTKK